jgi:hypothetical protein
MIRVTRQIKCIVAQGRVIPTPYMK